MNDWMFNVAMTAFALLMFFMAGWKEIHTGVLGSLGFVVLAITAMVMIEDASFNMIGSGAILFMCLGVSLISLQAMIDVIRMNRRLPEAKGTPHRRSTDWGALGQR